jgi:signal transduction histidine kinase
LNDLLALSKTKVVSRRRRAEWLEPAESLAGVLEEQGLRAREKGLKWRVEKPGSLPRIHADAGLLRTLAENIIANAIKYTPEGGFVTVSFRSHDDGVAMAVHDTGIGISSDDLDRIGQEFFRTREAQDSGSGGTGLGMTIVLSVVKTMRGKLDIQSELGAGTTVTVVLPSGHDRAPPPAGPPEQASATPSSQP